VLMLSAWFHDSGYVANGGSLEKSIEIARDFLARQKQPGSLADAVADCLKDTADGEAREGRVRDVLHDALLAPLASKSYIELEYVYFLRKLLIHRRRSLQLTYNILIYGLAASLLCFMIAIFRSRKPSSTAPRVAALARGVPMRAGLPTTDATTSRIVVQASSATWRRSRTARVVRRCSGKSGWRISDPSK